MNCRYRRFALWALIMAVLSLAVSIFALITVKTGRVDAGSVQNFTLICQIAEFAFVIACIVMMYKTNNAAKKAIEADPSDRKPMVFILASGAIDATVIAAATIIINGLAAKAS